jgi:hypothetical protein
VLSEAIGVSVPRRPIFVDELAAETIGIGPHGPEPFQDTEPAAIQLIAEAENTGAALDGAEPVQETEPDREVHTSFIGSGNRKGKVFNAGQVLYKIYF